MATHSTILAQRIPWMEELVHRLQPMDCQDFYMSEQLTHLFGVRNPPSSERWQAVTLLTCSSWNSICKPTFMKLSGQSLKTILPYAWIFYSFPNLVQVNISQSFKKIPTESSLCIYQIPTWCSRRLLRVSWIAKRSNQSIQKEIKHVYSLEGVTLKLKLQYFGHVMQRADSLEKTLMLVRMEGKKRRGWQKIRQIASPTQCT